MHQSLREQMGRDGTQIYSTQFFATKQDLKLESFISGSNASHTQHRQSNYYLRTDCFQSIESISTHQIHRNWPTRSRTRFGEWFFFIVDSNIEIDFKSRFTAFIHVLCFQRFIFICNQFFCKWFFYCSKQKQKTESTRAIDLHQRKRRYQRRGNTSRHPSRFKITSSIATISVV